MTDSKSAYAYGKFILSSGVVIFAIGQSLLFIVVAPLARSVGLSELQFGIAFSLANVSLIFAGPYWGRKSDVIGRKPVFTIGLFGSGIGTLAMAGTLTLGLKGALARSALLAMIFFSRMIYGLTASSIYPAASGYIADVTGWEDRAKGMALIGGANAIGSILGPAIGGGLAWNFYSYWHEMKVSRDGKYWGNAFAVPDAPAIPRDRWICRQGRQVWQVFDGRQFRYLQLVVRKAGKEPVKLHKVSALSYEYPITPRGRFESSDKTLTEIWSAARNTLFLHLEDTLLWDATRERAQYPIMTTTETPLYALCAIYGDTLMAEKMYQATARMQLASGHLPVMSGSGGTTAIGLPPSQVPYGRINLSGSPNCNFGYVFGIYAHYLETGDAEMVERLYPSILKLTRYFEMHADSRGLLENLPLVNWVDWTGHELRGINFLNNASRAHLLEVVVELVKFGPPEYFSLMVLGLTLLTFLGSKSMIRALMMAVLGLFISTIGVDYISGKPRFTYHIMTLMDGLDIVPVVIGLFGVAEVLVNIEAKVKKDVYETKIKNIFPNLQDWKDSLGPIIRGSFLGFFVGILPGPSAVIASFTSYTIEKKLSRSSSAPAVSKESPARKLPTTQARRAHLFLC